MKILRLLIFVGVGISAATAVPAQIAPVAITASSFTGDAVFESPDAMVDHDLSDNTDFASEFLVTHDYAVGSSLFDPDNVLPQNGTITNQSNGAVFQFQPFDAPNFLAVSGDATLTLSSPASFSEISFLVFNRTTRGGGPLSFTLNYVGGGTMDGASDGVVPFWESDNEPVGGGIAASLTTVLEGGDTAVGPVQFDAYDFNINPTLGLLESITFHGGSNKLNVFAVSGIEGGPVAIPEPGSWAMILAAAGIWIAARRVKKLVR